MDRWGLEAVAWQRAADTLAAEPVATSDTAALASLSPPRTPPATAAPGCPWWQNPPRVGSASRTRHGNRATPTQGMRLCCRGKLLAQHHLRRSLGARRRPQYEEAKEAIGQREESEDRREDEDAREPVSEDDLCAHR